MTPIIDLIAARCGLPPQTVLDILLSVQAQWDGTPGQAARPSRIDAPAPEVERMLWRQARAVGRV